MARGGYYLFCISDIMVSFIAAVQPFNGRGAVYFADLALHILALKC